ncbi:hypothetical protein E1301_Tti015048 [Triplophysa tibetana]|uniref:C2 calcium-dependent domain-containing protein 4C n=1 Tax=Triplophysa tibetana TaxID=1572043 RepID=A0A5A9NRZ6_9TELE|nr:hypothetical protein E1301_Tti015048 [Triplophysa tibetana]
MEQMHKNMAVTRTISAGNCAGTSADSESESVPFPFARRHSSAGIRALMWASACSFGSSLGSESRGSKDSIRSIVVTPDSIPQFTIPKLALDDGYRSRSNERERQSEEEDWGSTDDILKTYPPQLKSSSLSSSVSSTSSSGFGLSPCPGRKFLGGVSDHASLKRMPTQSDASFSCPEHFSDPGSRAALSLPHLPKFTTPYGFITLSKSPQMASEETLLQTGHRRSPEAISSKHPKLEMKRSVPVKPSFVQTRASTSPHPSTANHRYFRSHSVAEIEIRRQLAERKEFRSTPASQAPVTKNKRSLWGVLRKHFKNQNESLFISI